MLSSRIGFQNKMYKKYINLHQVFGWPKENVLNLKLPRLTW